VKRVLQIVLVVVLGAGAYGLWVKWHPTPEQAIRKTLNKLAENLVSKPGQGNIANVAAVNRTLSYFTPDVLINGEGMARVGESIQGRTELQQALFAARRQLEGAIDFADVHVQVASETNAVANFTAIGRLAGEKDPYSQDLKAQFVKVDGDWLIARVDAITLSPPKTTP
jgi:hypothetical protein